MRSKLPRRRALLAIPLLLLALVPLAGCEAIWQATVEGVFYSDDDAPHCDVVLVPRHHHHRHHRWHGH